MCLTILILVSKVFISDLEAVFTDKDVVIGAEDLEVLGKTTVEGTLPIDGKVGFTGKLKASGSVKIVGTTGPGFQRPISEAISTPSFPILTLGTNFFSPGSLPIVSIPSYAAPTNALPIFAPSPLELLSRIRNSCPRLNQLTNPNKFLCKRPLFIPLMAVFDTDNSKVTKASLIKKVDCDELAHLPDIEETLPKYKEVFIDTGYLLPVRGKVSINARF